MRQVSYCPDMSWSSNDEANAIVLFIVEWTLTLLTLWSLVQSRIGQNILKCNVTPSFKPNGTFRPKRQKCQSSLWLSCPDSSWVCWDYYEMGSYKFVLSAYLMSIGIFGCVYITSLKWLKFCFCCFVSVWMWLRSDHLKAVWIHKSNLIRVTFIRGAKFDTYPICG